jgi:predicted HTH transcriptional regulator
MEGPILARLEAATTWLATTMLHAVEVRGFGRADMDEYPVDALREVVLMWNLSALS